MDRNWTTDVVRYPNPAIEVIDSRFAPYVIGNCAVERIYTGCRWAEGPVWFGDLRCLIWSDIPNNRMLRCRISPTRSRCKTPTTANSSFL